MAEGPTKTRCVVGHYFEYTGKGSPPMWCPEHKKYQHYPISDKTKPPARIMKRWEETGKSLSDPTYPKRWKRRWEFVARVVAARNGTWAALPIDTIQELIQHERLAELHLVHAERQPYPDNGAGVKAHPGWERARLEEVAARRTARELGLLSSGEEEAARRDPSRLQEAASQHGVIDDQEGL